MGLDINSVRFLIAAKKQGVRFDDVLMIGRHSLNIYPAKLAGVLAESNLPNEIGADWDGFAEPFFRSLGAKRVDALDASDFEGAAVIHDLNLPIREDMKQRYDVVYDGGTLEHVFNFPVALQTCMEMVREGGSLFLHTCMNNQCGHGFYQFSPELFYRALSSQNGYEVVRMIAHRIGPYNRWYEITDPNQIRERVELITFTPMHMLVHAKRVKAVPTFAQPPQQSDYTAMWQAGQTPTAPAGTAESGGLKRVLPGLARLIHVAKMGLVFYSRQSLGNRKFFRPTNKT